MILAAMLVAGTASASGGVSGKGDVGGKGGKGPSTGGSDTGEETGSPDTDEASNSRARRRVNADVANELVEEKRWWLGAGWESHRAIRQEDAAPGSAKVSNTFSLSAGYDLTSRDTILAGWGLDQAILADQGETGFRSSDINIAYTRTIPLPERFMLRATPSFSLPISYYSRLATNITTLHLGFSLSRRFGDLSLAASINGGLSIDKYAEAGVGTPDDPYGGQPNNKWSLGGALQAEYTMPFHHPLSIGITLSDSYHWAYNVQNGPGGQNSAFVGVVQDNIYTSQPMLQSYAGEIFARYLMPELNGFKSDVLIAVTDGDSGLGYNALLHDGVVHPYLFFRRSAGVYGALSVRY
jgi:hypothetical protein